jgi:ParB/RepB/Spo0J family partition protein
MTTTHVPTTHTDLDIRSIAVSLIDPPEWNSRTEKTGVAAKADAEELEKLAASLKEKGQLQPIEVELKPDGRYLLIFGSRRWNATKLNNGETIIAIVREPSNLNERIIRNIEENERRRNLTTFEQARAFAQLRNIGMTNDDIAGKMHVSKSHVSNQIATFTRLPDPILKEWSKDHPAATFDFLKEVSQLDTDEKKVRAWDDRVSEMATAAANGTKAGKRGKGKGKGNSGTVGYSVVKANVDLAIDFLSPRRVADEKIGGNKKWAYQFMLWLIGQRSTLPEGIIPPASSAGK